MGEIKDLFDITEDDFKKKELPKEKSNMIATPRVENKEEIDDAIEEKPEKPNKKIKKHFEYRDGRVKYINFFSKNKKRGINDVKEEVSDIIKVNKNRADKSLFLRNISLVIIIFSVVFIYFYYVKGSSKMESLPLDNEIIIENNDKKPIENSKDTGKDEIVTLSNEEIINRVKVFNGKEVDKVEKYLDVKSNKVSTISDIKKYMKEKENLYLSLVESKKMLSPEEFEASENLIVKSIGMSKEFLAVFDENKGNNGLRQVIEKYK